MYVNHRHGLTHYFNLSFGKIAVLLYGVWHVSQQGIEQKAAIHCT